MTFKQIAIPDGFTATMELLEDLSHDEDVYAVYWPSLSVVEKYGCDPSPRMRSFSKAWDYAKKNDKTESIVYNLQGGHSALVRIE